VSVPERGGWFLQVQFRRIRSDDLLLNGRVDETRHDRWLGRDNLVGLPRVAMRWRPGFGQPPFFLVPPLEFSGETFCAPLHGLPVSVREERSLEPLIFEVGLGRGRVARPRARLLVPIRPIGWHGCSIGTGATRPSVAPVIGTDHVWSSTRRAWAIEDWVTLPFAR